MTSTNELVHAVEYQGEYFEIVEMWESFSGWYWFTTEKHPYKDEPNIRYGLVFGFDTEWGTYDVNEMKALPYKIWLVPKENWSNNSHVKLVSRSEITK